MRYQPRIIKRTAGLAQIFEANLLVIEGMEGDPDGGMVIFFGDIQPEEGVPLDRGTPIHHLILQLSGDKIWIELNDQGNQRSARQVARFELSPTSFQVVFAPGEGPYAGRVSLSPDLEIFDDVEEEELDGLDPLSSIRVGLAGVAAQVEALRRELNKRPSTAAKLLELEQDEEEEGGR